MSLSDRVKATAKNIQGKVQAAAGELIGDPQTKEEGEEKQSEARVAHTVEDIKDKLKKSLD